MNQLSAGFRLEQTRGAIDSINFSDRTTVSCFSNTFFFYDYLLNKTGFVTGSEYLSPHPRFEIRKPSLLSSSLFLRSAGKDSVKYQNFLLLLRQFGKNQARFESVYARNDSVYLFTSFCMPLLKGRDTVLRNSYFICCFIGQNPPSVAYIDETGFPEKFQIDNTAPFFTSNGKAFHLAVFRQDNTPSDFLFSYWSLDKNAKLHYLGMDSLTTPPFKPSGRQ